MDRFIFNNKTDAVLIRFYQTYEKTLDTDEYVSPRMNAFVYKFIGKEFKRTLRKVSKETRKKMKRFRKEAKRNGLTLDEYLEILEMEDASAENQEEENFDNTTAETGESVVEQAQESAEDFEASSVDGKQAQTE